MALSRHDRRFDRCPLLKAKRTSPNVIREHLVTVGRRALAKGETMTPSLSSGADKPVVLREEGVRPLHLATPS